MQCSAISNWYICRCIASARGSVRLKNFDKSACKDDSSHIARIARIARVDSLALLFLSYKHTHWHCRSVRAVLFCSVLLCSVWLARIARCINHEMYEREVPRNAAPRRADGEKRSEQIERRVFKSIKKEGEQDKRNEKGQKRIWIKKEKQETRQSSKLPRKREREKEHV